MPRYFIELSYKGTNYAGFQAQQNANTIQAEVEKALHIYYKNIFQLTGSSRTDAGVHALQNFFHFDIPTPLNQTLQKDVYHLNAILPADIAIHSIQEVAPDAHCRFSAVSRSYQYHIHQQKNPFLQNRAFYCPYPLDYILLQHAATALMSQQNFTTFSKKHTQVKTFICNIIESRWEQYNGELIYCVTANRFLRGMVKGLVATMLLVAKKKISLDQFNTIIQSHDNTQADFSVPSHGLFLVKVQF